MWWKIALIAVVLVVSIAAIVPTEDDPETIPLGLDLKGGTHLVMQVNTEDAVNAEIDQAVERVRSRAQELQLPTPTVRRLPSQPGDPPSRSFLVVPPPEVPIADYEKLLADSFPDFQVSRTSEGLVARLADAAATAIEEQTVAQAIETIRNRIDALGVTEPIIARQGGLRGKRIVIQLPGVDDPQRVKEIIRTTAQLQFRLVEGSTYSDPQAVYDSLPAAMRDQVDILPLDAVDEFGRVTGRQYLAVRKSVPVTGRDLKTARVQKGQLGEPIIGMSFSPEGGAKFHALTSANVGRQLAIVLDEKIESAPRINSPIRDDGVIEGSFTPSEAADLALVLRSGSLPASLTTLEERTVGPSLGRDSIRQGVTASLIGFVLVVIFVLFYYRGAGVNAVVALVLNLVILLGAMAYLGATLTLPGIAGVILTLAMAIDSNVLVFERIKEELRAGKSVRASIDSGFTLAFGTIIDTHLTTIIAGLFLFQFGSGPVKGFAVTLLIGLAASVYTAFFVSRVIFELIYFRGERRPERISI
ncbi:MAG TPA: protein translocase subunit SecD [Thermoanaerobaculia bacterium]|nr:protein translocase subunit SecD [Thermoanaerobaculia bacterium]